MCGLKGAWLLTRFGLADENRGASPNAEDGEKAPSSVSQNKTREDYEKAEKLNSALNLKKLSDK